MWWEIVLLTLVFEILTISGRLLFGPMKKRYKKIKFRYKVRIHHGYTGLFLVFLSLFFWKNVLFIIGLSLFFSDMIHHFIVLKLWTSKTEFP